MVHLTNIRPVALKNVPTLESQCGWPIWSDADKPQLCAGNKLLVHYEIMHC